MSPPGNGIKTPTPQGISALLRKAGFTRGIVKMRGGCSGFRVRAGSPGEVLVSHHLTLGTWATREREGDTIGRYAELLTQSGYATGYDKRAGWLVVTAREG